MKTFRIKPLPPDAMDWQLRRWVTEFSRLMNLVELEIHPGSEEEYRIYCNMTTALTEKADA